jgi:serine/threonine protein kinase
MAEAEKRTKPSDPPSAETNAGVTGRGVFRAVDPSQLAVSAEDLEAMSIRSPTIPPEPMPMPSADISQLDDFGNPAEVWDPMKSFAMLDPNGPPSVDVQSILTAAAAPHARVVRAPRDPAQRVGEILGDRYQLRRLLGQGGMAAVFEARDKRNDGVVALKLMHPAYSDTVELVARFRREAMTASEITSPHIVRFLDVGLDEHTGLYLVMERLDGESLQSLLDRAGKLSPAVACSLAAQAAEGLAAAHEAGVFHRDVKPGNLFLARRSDGTVLLKLLDFGVAKPEFDPSADGLTRVGTVLGTPQYMAPEQARAQGVPGPRVDVYALGAVLFEMVTGRPAFEERDTVQATLLAVATETAPRLRDVEKDVSPELDALVSDMMCPEPAMRIADMRNVLKRLQKLGADAARPPRLSELQPPSVDESRNRATVRPKAEPDTVVTGAPQFFPERVPSIAAPPPADASRGRTLAIVVLIMVVAAIGIGLIVRG